MVRGLKFHIKAVEGLYNLCSENKGAYQLCGYREAEQRLCFRIYVKSRISHAAALVFLLSREEATVEPDTAISAY